MEFRRVLFRSSDYEKERGERIDELLADTGKQAKLDILFLSHIHEDHVNGVEKLLDKTDGLKVDTIVLPLLPIEDRLIAFGRSITDDPAAGKNAFFRDLIIDPAAALARFGPRQILFVSSEEHTSELQSLMRHLNA